MSQVFFVPAPPQRQGGALWRFRRGQWYVPLLTAAAMALLFTGETLAGLALLLATGSLLLALAPDVLAALYPLLLAMLMSSCYYEDNSVLFRYAPAAALPLIALLWRLRRRPPARRGCFDGSLLAVSAATVLGGTGTIPAGEYFTAVGLFYTLGLGPLLLALYRYVRAELGVSRRPDLVRRFFVLLYGAGLFTAALVAQRYLPYLAYFRQEWQVIHIPCRNYLATMLLVALPAPFALLGESRLHALGAALLATAALLTGSRSALLFVPVMGLLCALWYARERGLPPRARGLLALLLGAAAALLTLLAAKTLFLSRATEDGLLFSAADSRVTFLRLAWRDFLAHPLTGQGLANLRNSDVFLGVTGSIVWYHNYFAQILGSMGLLGAAAYGWQLRDRLRLLGRLPQRAQPLGLVWLGMGLISLTNPGEFSPLPQAALMVILFAVAEQCAEGGFPAPPQGDGQEPPASG